MDVQHILNSGDQNRPAKPTIKFKIFHSQSLYSKITMINDLFDFEGRHSAIETEYLSCLVSVWLFLLTILLYNIHSTRKRYQKWFFIEDQNQNN